MAKRSGLGRGLESLLGEAAGEVEDEQRVGVRELSIDDVVANPNQPRKSFLDEELSELADSVRQNGVLQPILVRPYEGHYQIVAGERRYQAAKMAGLTTIPVMVRELDDEKVLIVALVENLQRSDLNAMEEARGYRMLMDQNGLTQQQLSEVLSKSRSSIANTLRLNDLPDEVQKLLSEGKLSAGHARAILSVKDDAGRVQLARKVVAEELSVRQTESLAPLFSGREEKGKHPRTPQPDSYKRAAKTLRNALRTKVSVRTVRGKSKIEIEFENEEQLNDLVNQLGGTAVSGPGDGEEGELL